MTAARWPTVGRCKCRRLEQEHKIREDGSRGGTDDGTCPGYDEIAREERPPAAELRRRLDRIVSLLLVTDTMQGACCARGRANARRVIEIARGEDPGAGGE